MVTARFVVVHFGDEIRNRKCERVFLFQKCMTILASELFKGKYCVKNIIDELSTSGFLAVILK